MRIAKLILLTALVSLNAAAQSTDDPGAASEAPSSTMPGPGYGMTPSEMREQMQKMHEQRMQMMQANPGGMPMMGRGAAMMPPAMRERMQQMHEQRMQMMQQRQAAAPAQDPTQGAADPAEPGETPAMGMPGGPGGMMHPCGKMYGGKGYGPCGMQQGQGMRAQMMERRRQHMQNMEDRLARIEALLQQLLDARQGGQ